MSDTQRDFEDLTLWEVLWLFVYHPIATVRRLFGAIALDAERKSTPATPENLQPDTEILLPTDEALLEPSADEPAEAETEPITENAPTEDATEPLVASSLVPPRAARHAYGGRIVGLMLIAFIFAFIGGRSLWSAAIQRGIVETNGAGTATFWFFLALCAYIAANVFISFDWWKSRLANWRGDSALNEDKSASPSTELDHEETIPEPHQPTEEASSDDKRQNPAWLEAFFKQVEQNSVRMALVPVGIALSYLAYTQNVITDANGMVINVRFTNNGTLAWLTSIAVWFALLGLDLNTITARLYAVIIGRTQLSVAPLRQFARAMRPRWQHIVLLLIMLLAAYFRFDNLSSVPPEMTSDHIEKVLDGLRVHEGFTGIFFPNNGGRESFQMYFIAALVRFGGLDFSFNTLKIATGIEGLLTVFAGYWLGVVIMGKDNRRMGLWLGLSFAALLAVSSWHTMLSRLGLRIALTPLTTLVLLIFLARAMRYNRRLDFVLMGLTLGAGTYFYQANRMLPILVVLGIGMATVVYTRSWQDLATRALHLATTAVLAFVIFVPLYRYGEQFPDDFWNRTRGRLFGENAFQIIDEEAGTIENYQPSIGEQIERFVDEIDVFQDNYYDALRMWSWTGDAAWINNGAGRPALDPYSNALLILGLAAWLALIIKRWDVVHVMIPFGVLVMLLPSALTLAYTVENPSFTRASGTIPFIFLIAAYPLAQLAYYLEQLPRRAWLGVGLVLLLSLPIIGLAGRVSYENYFTVYRDGYAASWQPYDAIATPMRDFAQSDEGSYNNAFMIAYPHWLDHRILGTVAGDIRWNNGLITREDLVYQVERNIGTDYEYRPDQPTFIMYNAQDIDTAQWLRELFPNGEEEFYSIVQRPSSSFNIYMIPPNIDWEAARAVVESENEEG